MTIVVDVAFRATLAVTCPVSTAKLRIGSERSRSIIPLVMSSATAIAVEEAPYPVVSSRIPGTT